VFKWIYDDGLGHVRELHKLAFKTAQIHLELPFCVGLHTKKAARRKKPCNRNQRQIYKCVDVLDQVGYSYYNRCHYVGLFGYIYQCGTRALALLSFSLIAGCSPITDTDARKMFRKKEK